MAMKNPAHPGSLIRDNLDALGLSVAEAAAGLGVTRQQLYRVMKGEHGLTPEMALRLEQAFGGSAGAWLRMQVPFSVTRVVAVAPPERTWRDRLRSFWDEPVRFG